MSTSLPASSRAHAPIAIAPVLAVAVVAMVLARLVGPALLGAAVGLDAWIERAERLASAASLLAEVLLVSLLARAGLRLLQGAMPGPLKGAAVVFAAVATAASIVAGSVPFAPKIATVIAAAAASVLAIVLGVHGLRRHRNAFGLALALVGVASLARGAGAYAAERTAAIARDVEAIRASFARAEWLATAASLALVVGLGLCATVAWRAAPRRLAAPMVAAIALAFLAAAFMSRALPADESSIASFVRRSLAGLATLPTPRLPPWLTTFGAVFAPLLSVALCFAPHEHRTRGAAPLALALLVGVSAEVPVLCMCLVAGAIAFSAELAREPPDPDSYDSERSSTTTSAP
jgi:hypothetical protein